MSRPVTFFVVDHVPRFTRIGGCDVGRAAGDPLRLVGKARPWQEGDHALAVAARPFPVGDEIAADLDRRDDDMIAPFAPAPQDMSKRTAIPVIPSIDPSPAVAAAARVAVAIPVSIPMVDASALADPACVATAVHAPAIEDRRSLAPALQESLDWIAIRTAAAGELARLHAETVSTGQPVLGGLSAADLERLRALVDAWQPGQRPGRGGR